MKRIIEEYEQKYSHRGMVKTYSEMMLLPTFEERFEYLKCGGSIGVQTFGGHRYLNQILYRSSEWKSFKRRVILRDNGYDLGCEDVPIIGYVYVHHINPLSIEDVMERKPCVFDMENVISTSFETHNAIHYESEIPKQIIPVTRKENDTCPWR